MERIERIVVHVEEAVRLGVTADEAHLRLGLILLDSAAELIMHREIDHMLEYAEIYGGMLQSMEAQTGTVFFPPEFVADIRARTVSNTRRKKILREFDAKCDYLQEHERLEGPQVRVLKKLHEYRNETYHRDRLRPATLTNATAIYIYLVCTMLRSFPPHSIAFSGPENPAFLVPYLDPTAATGGFVGFDVLARVANVLLERAKINDRRDLGIALALHVIDRIDGLLEDVEFAANWFRDMTGDESWDLQAVLGMAQVGDDYLYMDVRCAADARGLTVPLRDAPLDEWRAGAEAIADCTSDVAAFAAFADLEDSLEPLEALVHGIVTDIDHTIQRQSDEMRGK